MFPGTFPQESYLFPLKNEIDSNGDSVRYSVFCTHIFLLPPPVPTDSTLGEKGGEKLAQLEIYHQGVGE
jgi:hypothetical protein